METAPRELPRQESDSLKLLKYLTEKLPGVELNCQHDKGQTSIGVTPVNPKYWTRVIHLMLNAYAKEFNCAILSSISNTVPCTAVILIYWKAPPKHETFPWPEVEEVAKVASTMDGDMLITKSYFKTLLHYNGLSSPDYQEYCKKRDELIAEHLPKKTK